MVKKSDTLKKLFSWSSESTRDVLGGVLKCFATATKKTESSYIEEALSQLFLPSNSAAKSIVTALFRDNSLASAFALTFHFLEAGTGWDAAAPNGKPLVEAYRDMAFVFMTRYTPSASNGDIKYLGSKFSSLAEYMEEFDPTTARYIKELLKDLERDPEYFVYMNILNAILQSWQWLGNKSITYRVLAALVRICPEWVDDTDSNRYEFIKILNEVSREW